MPCKAQGFREKMLQCAETYLTHDAKCGKYLTYPHFVLLIFFMPCVYGESIFQQRALCMKTDRPVPSSGTEAEKGPQSFTCIPPRL